MSLPIIFIHKGNSWYLPYIFLQAKLTNPSSHLYLLGDEDTRHFNGILKHSNLSDYSTASQALLNVYKHKSTLSWEFEYFCISRWFVLYEFLVAKGIDQCLYIDSDVLLFCNATEEAKRLKGCSMTMPYDSAHTNYILNVMDLKLWCEKVIDIYKYKEDFLEHHYSKHLKKFSAGGISDMNFFRWFKDEYPDKIKDISVPENGMAYDITIDTTQNYHINNNIKKIVFKENSPYGILIETKCLVRFQSLHFQGKSKTLIKSYFQFYTTFFKMTKASNDIRMFIKRFLNFLKNKVKSKL